MGGTNGRRQTNLTTFIRYSSNGLKQANSFIGKIQIYNYALDVILCLNTVRYTLISNLNIESLIVASHINNFF